MIPVLDTHATARRLAGYGLSVEQSDAIPDAGREATKHGGQVTPQTPRAEPAGEMPAQTVATLSGVRAMLPAGVT